MFSRGGRGETQGPVTWVVKLCSDPAYVALFSGAKLWTSGKDILGKSTEGNICRVWTALPNYTTLALDIPMLPWGNDLLLGVIIPPRVCKILDIAGFPILEEGENMRSDQQMCCRTG